MPHQFKKVDFANRRVFTADAKLGITFRQAAAPKPGESAAEPGEWGATLAGYCIIWGALSSDRGGYQVRIAKDAVTFKTPTLGTWNHDFSRPLGNTANQTLRLIADEIG